MAHRAGKSPAGTATRRTTAEQFFNHSSGQRINTDVVITKALKEEYPGLELSVTPETSCDLLSFAAAGHASMSPIEDGHNLLPSSLTWKLYAPPARRIDGSPGALVQQLIFGKFMYTWNNSEFIVYLVDGRDGMMSYPRISNFYILSTDQAKTDALVFAAGQWGTELHGEVWVYDGGAWQKSAELYQSVMKSTWDAVILDAGMKKAIIDDHMSFFQSRDSYGRLSVPWKRGIIYYGPPGNGKTISIKATMHMLYNLEPSVPTVYVRTLASVSCSRAPLSARINTDCVQFAGPEYSIKQIFAKARQIAPCYLVFEDLDTIVSDNVRSYFLNEVDGLKSNDGIFMIGSTNHLDRLDPGISVRGT